MNPVSKPLPTTLLCTVGTSLIYPNLSNLSRDAAPVLYDAFHQKEWANVARQLTALDPHEHVCGGEINSIQSLLDRGFVAAEPRLIFLCSDTDEGRAIGETLVCYWRLRGMDGSAVIIEFLQDDRPGEFFTRGLQALAREVCRTVRTYSPENCAINATGGYKAQAAVAIMVGQALGIPVYYKHERLDDIIAIPPLPVALDGSAQGDTQRIAMAARLNMWLDENET